jgi:signal transduction histidine kinase
MAQQLQPEATNLVIVAGSGSFDQEWLRYARSSASKLANSMNVSYLTNLTMSQFQSEVSHVPLNSIIVILTIFQDAAGKSFNPNTATMNLAKAASAPSYGPYSTDVGLGVVGTSTFTFEAMGIAVANLALDVLAGKTAVNVVVPQTYLLDARELKRWNLDRARLPDGANILFDDEGLWERYRWTIFVTLTVILVQSLAIGGLLVERKRRAVAETNARRRLLELVHINQSATVGALSASIAHELNQPLGAIKNNTKAAEIILRNPNPDIGQMREILKDITDDDQRAIDIISALRRMLKKRNEIDLQDLDVSNLVEGAVKVVQGEADRQRVEIDFIRFHSPLTVRVDRLHVQQVLLNTLSNAIEAMTDGPMRRVTITAGLSDEREAIISVTDTGPGISEHDKGRIFEAFYTTKGDGTGLGLSIARTIVEFYGGRIWAEGPAEQGLTIAFTLPLAPEP